MKILFIGGNGNISWFCTQIALERGHEVYHLNRGVSRKTRRAVQPEVKQIIVDRDDIEKIENLLSGVIFDVVCDFICYDEKRAEDDIKLFSRRAKHFVFISSEAVYKRVGYDYIYNESALQYDLNVECEYIKGKIYAEKVFKDAYVKEKFPVTIIRPAYTYDTIFPICVGHNCYTAALRILDGYPLLIAGNGENLWPFTHSKDFAEAFVRLIENKDTIGDEIQIVSDEYWSWNDQSEVVLKKLGVEKSNCFHIPFEDALKFEGIHSKEMMIQRMYNSRFDTEKLKSYLPDWRAQIGFEEGFERTINWLQEEPIRMRYVKRIDDELMKIYERYGIKNE